MWKGNPPNSLLAFTYKEKSIENIGEFNNEAVKLLERNEEGDWSEANSMLNAMISFDPLFFPARYNYARFLYMQKASKKQATNSFRLRILYQLIIESTYTWGKFLFTRERNKMQKSIGNRQYGAIL